MNIKESLLCLSRDVLRFFNLLDRGNKLSITNIAVIVLIVKMALAPAFDWTAATGLFVALFNYAHKRSETNKRDIASERSEALVTIEEKVNSMAGLIESYRGNQELVAKQSEETKKLLSNANLAQAFTPRKREQ